MSHLFLPRDIEGGNAWAGNLTQGVQELAIEAAASPHCPGSGGERERVERGLGGVLRPSTQPPPPCCRSCRGLCREHRGCSLQRSAASSCAVAPARRAPG
jgi:hypothetical protein